jgi:hypothetical protein
MKAILIFVMLFIVSSANSQTLKDALFSGKLKTDSSSTIKKGDSLTLLPDSVVKARMDSLKKEIAQKNPGKNIIADSATASSGSATPEDNNSIWKKFIDEYTEIVNKEIQASSKVKKGTYAILIEYYIETDGNITTSNVYCTPENSFIVEQIKVRMMMDAPKLSPVLMSNGKPRRALKKQTLTFVKKKD